MAGNATQQAQAARMRSTVFHKADYRINTLRRRAKKSDLISLYNIDCMMMFRVEAAHMQFDMLNNHRPYILFHGKAEGVYLPASTGLLFPNMCDELDFRTDYPVEAAISYELSDIEIGTLAQNGLFNYDWSCQGRVLGALLEIPCAVDYHAIANTPITYLEIQDRLNLRTSTRKTGYKTLVATFLPYDAQKHNQEKYPKLLETGEYDRDSSYIRKRSLYDSKAVGFMPEFADPDKDTVSFVQAAQARIHKKLEDQLAKANVLQTESEKTSKAIVDAVDTIKTQADKAKAQAITEAGNDARRLDAAVLDARLNDMKTRMAYQGAQDIPVETPRIEAESLAAKKAPGENDRIMTTPLTKPTLTADDIIAQNKAIADADKAGTGAPSGNPDITASAPADAAAGDIDATNDKIRMGVADAEKTATDVKDKVLSRKEKLALRKQQHLQAQQAAQQRLIEAGNKELEKGLTERSKDLEAVDVRKAQEQAETARKLKEAAGPDAKPPVIPEDDILADLYQDMNGTK